MYRLPSCCRSVSYCLSLVFFSFPTLTYAFSNHKLLFLCVSFLPFPLQVLLQEGERWVWVWSGVRGSVGRCHCAAHVRGQGPGQSGEDGLKKKKKNNNTNYQCPSYAQPQVKLSLKNLSNRLYEKTNKKKTSGLFFYFLYFLLLS